MRKSRRKTDSITHWELMVPTVENQGDAEMLFSYRKRHRWETLWTRRREEQQCKEWLAGLPDPRR